MLENPHAQAPPMKFSENTEGDSDPKTGNTCNALSGGSNLPAEPRRPRWPHSITPVSPLLPCRRLLRRVQHLQFLGGESRGRCPVPGGAQLQCDLTATPQHAAAQPEPTAAQPAGHSPGPAAEAAQQVRTQFVFHQASSSPPSVDSKF